jgi:hypothetical protein
MEFVAPTANPGAAIPGIDSTFDLGSPIYKWKNIYADDFIGRLTGNVTGNTVGVHKGNVIAVDDSTAYNATTKQFTGSFTGILTGNVIGDVTGTSSNAFTLNNLQGSVATVNSTVVIRDSSGNINATEFIGTSSRSNQLLATGIGYISASTSPTNNTLVVRDSNGSISANLLNGTATAANTLQANGGGYVVVSTLPVGDTIVVRDSAGNIQVNGIIGAATTANQLQVDSGTYRLATTSAVSNTIAVRDADGVLRSTSIQNTPIGTVTAAQGAFTTLSANNAVTFTRNTASTSTTSGTVVVTGGVGVSGAVHAASFNGPLNGNASTATSATTATSAANSTVSLRTQNTVTGTNSVDLVSGNMADNDLFRIRIGGTASNAGFVEIATADDGTEPIYVRQYSGVFSTIVRTATILNESGNTVFPGEVRAANIVETSSIAFKENINPIEGALENLLKLSGVTYDRKDTKQHEAGLIAEEVNKVFPELVAKDANGNPYGIHYTKLTAYLVEAVKTLKAELDQLKGSK